MFKYVDIHYVKSERLESDCMMNRSNDYIGKFAKNRES